MGIALIAVVAISIIAASVASADTGELKYRICIDDGVTTLTSKGVTCRQAQKVVDKAVRKSNCPPSPSFRGCYKTVRVGHWSCHGLFPGEGQSFTCRYGERRIHSSGGG